MAAPRGTKSTPKPNLANCNYARDAYLGNTDLDRVDMYAPTLKCKTGIERQIYFSGGGREKRSPGPGGNFFANRRVNSVQSSDTLKSVVTATICFSR